MGVACGSLACSAARVQTASSPWPDMDTWWSVLARLRVGMVSIVCMHVFIRDSARQRRAVYICSRVYLSLGPRRAGRRDRPSMAMGR